MPAIAQQGWKTRRISIAWHKTKPEMPPSEQPSRVNLQDLKDQMANRIGQERADKYFTYFKGYISLTCIKAELDRKIIQTIGKENITLHNQIVRAVLSNALRSESPPSFRCTLDAAKTPKQSLRKLSLQVTRNDEDSRDFLSSQAVKDSSTLSNGNILANDTTDTGGTYQKQRSTEQLQADVVKKPRIIPSLHTNIDSVKSAWSSAEVNAFKEIRSSEPFDLPFHPGIVLPAASKPLFLGFKTLFSQYSLSNVETEFLDSDGLPDSEILQKWMDHIAASVGLEHVNQDCIDVLNQGLEIYLKRLIKTSISYSRSKSAPQQGLQHENDGRSTVKEILVPLSGVTDSIDKANSTHMPESGSRMHSKDSESIQSTVSLMDFKWAMELNAEKLGVDWPLQLEKIRLHPFDFPELEM